MSAEGVKTLGERKAFPDLLTVEDLKVSYGAITALRGVSLRLGKGEVVALIGANGAGKTSTLRAVSGMLKPVGGRIRFAGEDTTGMKAHQLVPRGMAHAPEGRGIFPNLNVRENLQVAARPGFDGRNDWTYERVLDTFPRLSERLDHGGQQLSGGEQQMLSIGRALLTNPQLLILDEATEGLAPLIVAEIWRVIGEIRATGISTLIVDRNYRAVLAHTDRAVVLEKGLIVKAGPSAELALDHDALARHLGV